MSLPKNIRDFPLVILALYLLCGFCLLPLFVDFFCSDFISYAAVARKYANFDFPAAINAYWSPLLPWMMAPLIGLGVPELLAFRGLLVLFGAGIVWQIYRLLVEAGVSRRLQALGMLTAAVNVFYFCFSYSTPDILLVFFLLLYYRCHTRIFQGKRQAVLAGLVAALAYFAKTYAFVFILFHFAVVIFIHLLVDREQLRQQWKNLSWFLVTFLGVASIWIIILSVKYEHPTFGSSGKYNLQTRLASVKDGDFHYPMLYTLIAPPNETASSIWEDPPSDLAGHEAYLNESVLAGPAKHFRRLLSNIRQLGYTLSYYNPLFPAILLGVFYVLIGRLYKQKTAIINDSIFNATLFACLFPVAYMLLFFAERYIWTLFIFMIYFAILLMNLLLKGNTNKLQFWFVAIGFFLFSIYAPLDRLRNIQPYRQEEVRGIKDLAASVLRHVPPNSKIVINDRWTDANYISYLNDYQFYGVTSFYESEEQLLKELKGFDVDYFLVNSKEIPHDFLKSKEELSKGLIKDMKIYKLK